MLRRHGARCSRRGSSANSGLGPSSSPRWRRVDLWRWTGLFRPAIKPSRRRRLTAFECAAGPPRKRARFSSVSNRRVDQRGRTAPEYRRGGPEFGMMSPARFMPVAEHCGLIVPVRRWALAPVCLQLRGLRVVGLAPTREFANLVGAPASPGGPGRRAAGVSAPVTSRHL